MTMMYLRWSLCALCLLGYLVRDTIGNSRLCYRVCVMSSEHWALYSVVFADLWFLLYDPSHLCQVDCWLQPLSLPVFSAVHLFIILALSQNVTRVFTLSPLLWAKMQQWCSLCHLGSVFTLSLNVTRVFTLSPRLWAKMQPGCSLCHLGLVFTLSPWLWAKMQSWCSLCHLGSEPKCNHSVHMLVTSALCQNLTTAHSVHLFFTSALSQNVIWLL